MKGPYYQLLGRRALGNRIFYDNRFEGNLVTHPEMTPEAFAQFERLDLPDGTHPIVCVEVMLVEGKIVQVLGFEEQTLARKA